MKTNMYSVVFLLACSPAFADAPEDSSKIIPPRPEKLMLKLDNNCVLSDSLQNELNERYGIIPLDFSKGPGMLKILPGPNGGAKILKLMPEINKGILGSDKEPPSAIRPSK